MRVCEGRGGMRLIAKSIIYLLNRQRNTRSKFKGEDAQNKRRHAKKKLNDPTVDTCQTIRDP